MQQAASRCQTLVGALCSHASPLPLGRRHGERSSDHREEGNCSMSDARDSVCSEHGGGKVPVDIRPFVWLNELNLQIGTNKNEHLSLRRSQKRTALLFHCENSVCTAQR